MWDVERERASVAFAVCDYGRVLDMVMQRTAGIQQEEKQEQGDAGDSGILGKENKAAAHGVR